MEGKRENGFAFAGRKTGGKNADDWRTSDSDQDGREDEPDGHLHKPDGLMKQSFSITTSDKRYLNLISYYSRHQGRSNHSNSQLMNRHFAIFSCQRICIYPEATVKGRLPSNKATDLDQPRIVNQRAFIACKHCRARKVRYRIEHKAPCTNRRLDRIECIEAPNLKKRLVAPKSHPLWHMSGFATFFSILFRLFTAKTNCVEAQPTRSATGPSSSTIYGYGDIKLSIQCGKRSY